MTGTGETNPVRGVVVYLHITLFSIPAVLLYLLRGYRVLYLTMDPSPKSLFQWGDWLHAGQLRPLKGDDLQFSEGIDLLNRTLDVIEGEYDVHRRHHPLIAVIQLRFSQPEMHLPFKKVLAEEIHRDLRAAWVGKSIKRQFPPATEVLLVPERYPFTLDHFSGEREAREFLASAAIPRWVRFIGICSSAFHRFTWFLISCGFPFWILLQVGIPTLKKGTPERATVGLRVYRNDFSFHFRFRSIDFLVDGKDLTAENVVICAEDDIGDDYRKAMKAKGYRVVDIRKSLHRPHYTFFLRTIIREFFPLWAEIWPKALLEPPHMVRITLELLHRWLLWESFSENQSVRHYVVYNDNLPGNVMRTLVLTARGVDSWYYVHSAHSYDVFSPVGQRTYREFEFSYLHYTTIVVWGENMQRYYQICPNAIFRYVAVGCLWSEHVREARLEDPRESVLAAVSSKFMQASGRLPRKILGVFDTTFGGVSPLSADDMEAFFDMLFRLLEDLPDIGIILKMKADLPHLESTHPRLLPLYFRVRDHPRCYLSDPSQRDPAPVIAASDLVVSLAFTSTTIEALGARKRAIYLDPLGRFRGTYYDRFPDLVAHDYPQLLMLVRCWLTRSDEDFNEFLEKYVMGELDAYIDGMAITRFRTLLCEH